MNTLIVNMSNGEIEQALTGINKLEKNEFKGSPKLLFAIIKNRIELENAIKPFKEAQNQIIKEKSGGNEVLNKEENPDLFQEAVDAINEIALQEIEVCIVTVPLSELGEGDVSISIISSLAFMLTES